MFFLSFLGRKHRTVAYWKTAKKDFKEESDYRGRGDTSIVWFASSSDFAQICWKFQAFPIKKDSTLNSTIGSTRNSTLPGAR